jgi:protein-tyrosine-phosphatase
MAAALLNHFASEFGKTHAFEADSAGLSAPEGAHATALAIRVMTSRQIVLGGHRAKSVTSDLIQKADIVLCMTRGHLATLKSRFPESDWKLNLLGDVAGTGQDVIDPIGGNEETYERCARELESLIRTTLDHLSEG